MKKTVQFDITFEGREDAIIQDIISWMRIENLEKCRINNTQVVRVESRELPDKT